MVIFHAEISGKPIPGHFETQRLLTTPNRRPGASHTCDPQKLERLPNLPEPLRSLHRCDAYVLLSLLLVLLYWALVVNLLSKGCWRERYLRYILRWSCLVVLVSGVFVEDVAVLLLGILPLAINVGLLVGIVVELARPLEA